MKIGFNNEDVISKPFLTPGELAEFFSISKATVYSLVEKRVMPFYKIGGQLRFKRTDIEEYLEHSRINPISICK